MLRRDQRAEQHRCEPLFRNGRQETRSGGGKHVPEIIRQPDRDPQSGRAKNRHSVHTAARGGSVRHLRSVEVQELPAQLVHDGGDPFRAALFR